MEFSSTIMNVTVRESKAFNLHMQSTAACLLQSQRGWSGRAVGATQSAQHQQGVTAHK